ncbi:defense protein l(2)34Fc-like [Lucilia cuprina]|uniref:defense protein l(2)34Fc-like n=1 Tax=Lucilia cuprina TaxID=7375 RepID=UPI001F06883E|nr:defense protein l(2)34Fc-like [Lucilia cuprina]
MLRLIILVLCLAVPDLCYSKKELELEVCTDLNPGYNEKPQNTKAPYQFYGKQSMKSGEKITLSLSGDTFLDFIIQAQNYRNEPIGRFNVVESKKSKAIKCSAEEDTLINIDLYNKPMKGVQFEWLSPINYKGTVNFVATVFKDRHTFWVRKVTRKVTVI